MSLGCGSGVCSPADLRAAWAGAAWGSMGLGFGRVQASGEDILCTACMVMSARILGRKSVGDQIILGKEKSTKLAKFLSSLETN